MELQVSAPAARISEPGRVLSVDVLRGLVMFTMVFVNDAYGAHGLPNWMKHYEDVHPGGSGMTFVDVVFPAFLFIVGMSIPLAIENRRARGDSWLKIIGHAVVRTASLVFLGVLMVEDPSDKAMGWKPGLWQTLMFAGAIVTFHSLPLRKPTAKYVSWALRAVGLGLLIFLAFKFRTRHGGRLQHSWWGILGLIGWAYFGAFTIYLLLRKEGIGALMAGAALLMCVYFADNAHAFKAIHLFGHKYALPEWFPIGEAFGSQASISMFGVVLGSLLLPTCVLAPGARIRFAAVSAALMCVGALLLHKTFLISKDNATPSWCLWSSAITTVIWIGLYWLIDVAGWRAWSVPLAWAGASALLLYILSEGWDIVNEHYLSWPWYDRLAETYPNAVYHKFLTAAAISLIAGVAGRLGFRLRL